MPYATYDGVFYNTNYTCKQILRYNKCCKLEEH